MTKKATKTAREIYAVIAAIEDRRRDRPHESVGYEQELLALRDLVASFLDATDKECPESTITQARLLNQLHLAVGL